MMTNNKPIRPAGRYALLDELRGLDLINMIAYHALWDLIFLFGVQADWYFEWQGRLWQFCICSVFILLSGFCVPFGRHTFRRGWVVFGSGALVTAVTLIFMPADRVVFGVLTFLGSAMLLTALCRPLLEKIPAGWGLAASLVLFAVCYPISSGYLGVGSLQVALPEALYANYFTAYFGFIPWWFYSTDYFPLLPWLFLFWAGWFLHRVIGRRRMEPLRRSVCAPLGWLGRNSLVIYLLHQPLLYGAFLLIFSIGSH